MKERISPQDLKSLTAGQKEMLRSIWRPQKHDMAVASICTNVETDEYKDIEFVVGEVLVQDSGRHPRIVLRRLRLMDEPVPEDDAAHEDSDEEYLGQEDAEDGDDLDVLYIEPEDYFYVDDCLPLLSIGQMLYYIRKSKFGQRGFELAVPPEDGKIFEEHMFRFTDSDGETYENEELCDLLWEIFKTYVLGGI